MRSWRQKRSAPRRQQLIEAALICFGESGLEQAAVEDIARRAGVSTGSIYHQFGNKNGLAAAVYLEGLQRYQTGMIDALKVETGARAGINAIIQFHLQWVDTHEPWARFLLTARRTDFVDSVEDDICALNRDFGLAMASWCAPLMQSGRLRRLPVDLLMALLLGPCHEYIRGRLGNRQATSSAEAQAILADAAWRALSSHEEAL